ncbi:hypothetical protein, partial [Stutzerimonas stutzeri]|uniref:hypothetical protein n=1 Tax=Stutzerimonas stutzeri TaxID=316 RepID=UPI0024B72BB0
YPLDPVQFADPLGLRGLGSFGDGFNHYCQQAGSAVTYQPSEEAMVTIHNMETTHNVYNPLSEYVFGLSAGSAIAGMGGMSFRAAAVAEKGSACIKDVAESMIK